MHIGISQGNFCAVRVIETARTYENTSNEHPALTATVRTPSVTTLFGDKYIIHHYIIILTYIIYIYHYTSIFNLYIYIPAIYINRLWPIVEGMKSVARVYWSDLSEWQRFTYSGSVLEVSPPLTHCNMHNFKSSSEKFESKGIPRCPKCLKCTKLPEGCDGTRPRNTCSAAVSTSETQREQIYLWSVLQFSQSCMHIKENHHSNTQYQKELNSSKIQITVKTPCQNNA